jgi:hypothetical protein
MEESSFDRSDQKVAYLMDAIPQTRRDYLLLILTYWQIFDGIDLPEATVAQIIEKATAPETITRSRRKVTERDRYKQLLQLQRMYRQEE